MKRLTRAICLLPSLILPGGMQAAASESRGQAAPPSPPAIPRVIARVPGATATWVEASRVLTPSGEVDPKLFSPDDAKDFRRMLDRPEVGGCIYGGSTFLDELVILGETPSPARSLADALKSSELILVGTVTNKSYGFSSGIAGQLVQVRPDVLIKDSKGAQDDYYLFIPVGTFKVGSKTICKVDSREAPAPEIGEQVALFVRSTTRGDSAFIHPIEASHITIKSDGSLLAPDRLKSGLPTTKRELLQILAKAAAQGGS